MCSELVKLELLEKHCLPLLLYNVEVFDLSCDLQKELNSMWNYVYRKVFGFNKWESLKQLVSLSGRLNVIYMINLRTVNFF